MKFDALFQGGPFDGHRAVVTSHKMKRPPLEVLLPSDPPPARLVERKPGLYPHLDAPLTYEYRLASFQGRMASYEYVRTR